MEKIYCSSIIERVTEGISRCKRVFSGKSLEEKSKIFFDIWNTKAKELFFPQCKEIGYKGYFTFVCTFSKQSFFSV